jgi:hypothetical protein
MLEGFMVNLRSANHGSPIEKGHVKKLTLAGQGNKHQQTRTG